MIEPSVIALTIISIAAFFLKGLTGFGPAIVVISLGIFFIPIHDVIILGALLDLTAGIILLKQFNLKIDRNFMLPILASVSLGTVLGSVALSLISEESLRPILAVAIVIIAIYFIFLKNSSTTEKLSGELPKEADLLGASYSFLGGLSGGFFGISAPPIIWHFGRRHSKEALRKVLIIIFFIAALTRSICYVATGLLTSPVLIHYAFSVPGLALGLYLGNKSFYKISEKKFGIIVGILLIAASLKLVL